MFLIIILIKEKLNYKNCFLKKLREKKKKVCAGRVGLCKLVVMQLNRVVRIKSRGCFRVLKVLGKKTDYRIVESFLKEFFRTSSARIFYIQIVCISTVSIIMSPKWIAAIILAFALFAISVMRATIGMSLRTKCFFIYIVMKANYSC